MSCPAEIRDVLKDVTKMPICLHHFHSFRTVQLSHNLISLYLWHKLTETLKGLLREGRLALLCWFCPHPTRLKWRFYPFIIIKYDGGFNSQHCPSILGPYHISLRHRSEPLRLWHLTFAVHEEHDANLRHVLWRIYELQQQCCEWCWWRRQMHADNNVWALGYNWVSRR